MRTHSVLPIKIVQIITQSDIELKQNKKGFVSSKT